MAKPDRDAEFTEYVRARQTWLRRVAYLLCGDWHQADDLVQSAITKLYAHWHRARRADNLDGYARRTLVNTYLAERRSGWAKWTNPASGAGIAGDLSLEWQTASGSWFKLGGDYSIHGTELEARLIKIAESVTAEEAPVALPIHVEGLPAGVQLGEAMLNDPVEVGKDGFSAGLTWHVGGEPGKDSTFGISVRRTADKPSPGTAAADHSARIVTSDPSHGIPGTEPVCKDSDGLHICVQDAPNAGVDPLASIGGAEGLLDRITSLGTDRANWTTHVVN